MYKFKINYQTGGAVQKPVSNLNKDSIDKIKENINNLKGILETEELETKNITSKLNEINLEIDSLKSNINTDLQSNLSKKKEELIKFKNEISSFTQDTKNKNEKLITLENEIKKFNEDTKKKNTELTILQNYIKNKNTELSTLQNDITSLTENIENNNTQIDTLKNEITSFTENTKNKDAKLKTLQNEIIEIEQKI